MPMDRITAGLLAEFTQQFELINLDESKRFEHFACYLTVHSHHSPTFSTADILTGAAIGIDGIAIIVNGTMVKEVEEVIDIAEDSDYLDCCSFLFKPTGESISTEANWVPSPLPLKIFLT